MSKQLTDSLIMIRPRSFGFNPETESSNKFQKRLPNLEEKQIRSQAIKEFDEMVSKLRSHDIDVNVFDDLEDSVLPDSVFPNNWISTHEDGSVYTYPMFAPVRRKERREDIIESLGEKFKVIKRYSLEVFEVQNQFLEGTGSLILDRDHRIAYACLSPRTDARVLHKFSLLSGYRAVFFKAADQNGFEIYHTNVLMALGHDFVICCMNAIDQESRAAVVESFHNTGKELIDITFEQMSKFAGNMLEVKNKHGKRFLILSETAYESLNKEQISLLSKRTELLPVTISTIENIGGGSARCMIAENFLARL
jgi:hypothetical protein